MPENSLDVSTSDEKWEVDPSEDRLQVSLEPLAAQRGNSFLSLTTALICVHETQVNCV